MSSESNDKLWDRTVTALKQLVKEEEEEDSNVVNSGDEFMQHAASRYVQYMLVLIDLNKVYNGLVQAQKRLDVKKTIEHVISRIILLRASLTVSSYDLPNLNPALVELNISPSQLEAIVPLFVTEQRESISTRISKMVAKPSSPDTSDMVSDTTSHDDESDRVGSDHVDNEATVSDDGIEHEIDSQTIGVPNADGKENDTTVIEEEDAASKITSVCRGYMTRKRVANERIELGNFIGLSCSNKEDDLDQLGRDIAKVNQLRSQEQIHSKRIYETSLKELKDIVIAEEAFQMQMELREERIKWITDQTVTNHELPNSLEGFYDKDSALSQEDDVTDQGKPDKTELKALKECIATFDQRWKGRVVGSERIKSQAVDVEMAKELIIRNQVRSELTPGIDEKLLSNLQKIKASQDTGKKSKKKEKKGKGKSNKSGKKKGGGKKEKPLPGSKLLEIKDMQVQDMLDCLVQDNLIYKYDEKQKLTDFIGTFEARGESSAHDPPNAWELRLAALQLCVLPMSSKEVKASVQDESVRSILFYGDKGSGKTFMMESIAAELGALVIHLSSTSIGNAYQEGTEATKLIHMIFTVAREESLSPVIIYLDDCHEFFLGKPKKGGNSEDAINMTMKRFQKDLLIYKNQFLSKMDRVLIIGCSSRPEACDMKLLKWKGPTGGKAEKQGFFEHALYFPNPSTFARSLLWKEAVGRKVTGPCQLNFPLLAHLSPDYSAGAIFRIVDEVLCCDRVKNIPTSPLAEQNDFAPKLLLRKEQTTQTFADFRKQWVGSKAKAGAPTSKKMTQ